MDLASDPPRTEDSPLAGQPASALSAASNEWFRSLPTGTQCRAGPPLHQAKKRGRGTCPPPEPVPGPTRGAGHGRSQGAKTGGRPDVCEAVDTEPRVVQARSGWAVKRELIAKESKPRWPTRRSGTSTTRRAHTVPAWARQGRLEAPTSPLSDGGFGDTCSVAVSASRSREARSTGSGKT